MSIFAGVISTGVGVTLVCIIFSSVLGNSVHILSVITYADSVDLQGDAFILASSPLSIFFFLKQDETGSQQVSDWSEAG